MTSEREMAAWILAVLYELQGTAETHQVFEMIKRRFGSRLDAEDLADVSPWRAEQRWRNKAHTARRRMIEKGLLHSGDVTGRNVWSLTAAGTAEVPAAYLQPAVDLCSRFRASAADVQWRTRLGRCLRLAPAETTFTDDVLLTLAAGHRGSVSVQRFTSAQEARNGADWEWWIRDHSGYAGFRMQAKRAAPGNGRIAFDQKAARSAPAGEQIDVFDWRCRNDGIAGLYCIYSDALPVTDPPGVTASACPHGRADFRQWACTVLPVDTALLLRRLGKFDAATALSYGAPWYQLVCSEPVRSVTDSAFQCFSGLRAQNITLRRSTQRHLEIDDGYPDLFDGALFPSREPPQQVVAAFDNGLGRLRPWAGLTGVILIDARDVLPAAF
ncbi:hypothetical protein AB0F72_36645 [Actinoplanes sp. NPDC023936]|uniref:hypothetical protein n=1 Tax=Actinoplanes sp. NPDC023936 TaxID=3154910 RepID=UPI0033E4D62F